MHCGLFLAVMLLTVSLSVSVREQTDEQLHRETSSSFKKSVSILYLGRAVTRSQQPPPQPPPQPRRRSVCISETQREDDTPPVAGTQQTWQP